MNARRSYRLTLRTSRKHFVVEAWLCGEHAWVALSDGVFIAELPACRSPGEVVAIELVAEGASSCAVCDGRLKFGVEGSAK
jgi:hypothetical protein